VQAVVAPTSDIIGRTLRDIDFRRRYGAILVGLWREKVFCSRSLGSDPVGAEEVLALQEDGESLSRIGRDAAFLMILPFQGEMRL